MNKDTPRSLDPSIPRSLIPLCLGEIFFDVEGSLSCFPFRDGEDLDELLERQADMIRYLQQHNANLGRRILELQSQTME